MQTIAAVADDGDEYYDVGGAEDVQAVACASVSVAAPAAPAAPGVQASAASAASAANAAGTGADVNAGAAAAVSVAGTGVANQSAANKPDEGAPAPALARAVVDDSAVAGAADIEVVVVMVVLEALVWIAGWVGQAAVETRQSLS